MKRNNSKMVNKRSYCDLKNKEGSDMSTRLVVFDEKCYHRAQEEEFRICHNVDLWMSEN